MASPSKDSRLIRALFLPWFGTSHIIPMVDFARLVAAHNIHCTVAVTPGDVSVVESTVKNSCASGLHMDILTYPFPSPQEKSGLTPGLENSTTVPPSEGYSLIAAARHARITLVNLVTTCRPDVIVCDPYFSYISETSSELGIPYVSFLAVGMFPCCIMGILSSDEHHRSVSSDSEPFLVPGLPHRIELVRSELPDFFQGATEFSVEDVTTKAEIFGVVANSFREMEGEYAEHYEKHTGDKTWLVGPVSLAACGNEKDQAVRGSRNGNYQKCMEWLDKKPRASVVYLCFGSWCPVGKDQITELALGLERCGHDFMWVVREEEGLPEGYEERVKGRGLVVRGWVPQVAVLGHVAVGGFVCHCGWNSLVEGVCAGVPMVTWPLLVEQFISERLVTDVLRTGVRNWSGFRSTLLEKKVTVMAEDVAKAVRRIMDGNEEAVGLRRRAKEYGEKARMSVKEGGSSFNDLESFVAEIKARLNRA